jgi:hypothetical protein
MMSGVEATTPAYDNPHEGARIPRKIAAGCDHLERSFTTLVLTPVDWAGAMADRLGYVRYEFAYRTR